MAKLKLTKLQKLGVKLRKEKQNQVLHPHQNQGEKTIQNQAAGLHKNNNNLFHLLQCCQISILFNCILRDISHGTIIHINVFLAYLLIQAGTLLQQKPLPLVSFCSLQCSFVVANCSTNLIQTFHACPWTTRKRKRLTLSNFYSEISLM